MIDATTVADSAHSDSLDSIPFVRGLEKLIPPERLQAILDRTGRTEQRKRLLTAQSVVWLIVAMSLYARDSIPMVWRRLHASSPMPEPDPSALTKSRKRLGVRPMRELFQEVAKPIATPETPGAFHRGLRLMAIDGTTLDMPDTEANETVFGRGGNQRSPNAFPQVRVLALCEVGTHVVCGLVIRPISVGEQTMVPHLLHSIGVGMLLLWDRGFCGYKSFAGVCKTGCRLLARVKSKQQIFKRILTLADGSYLSKIYPTYRDRLKDRNGRMIRVIEFAHFDSKRIGYRVVNRLITDILDPEELSAKEAVRLYHERWEIEIVFDEIKTHQNSRDLLLRCHTPRGVMQELYGMFLAHRIVRQVIFDAATDAKIDPDRLSFLDSLRVIQCHLPEVPHRTPAEWYEQLIAEVRQQKLPRRRNRQYPRVVKRKIKKWDKKQPRHKKPEQPTQTYAEATVIL